VYIIEEKVVAQKRLLVLIFLNRLRKPNFPLRQPLVFTGFSTGSWLKQRWFSEGVLMVYGRHVLQL